MSEPKPTRKLLVSDMVEDLSISLPVHNEKVPDKQKKIKKIVLHMTDGIVTPRGLALYDIGPNHISETGCPTITYHYLVNQSGKRFKCVDHSIVTWHAGPHNRKSLAVAINYKADSAWEKAATKGVATPLPSSAQNRPSVKATSAVYALLTGLCLDEGVPPTEIWGHRELKGTGWTFHKGSKKLRKTCPGMSVDLHTVRMTVARGMQTKLRSQGLYNGELDGLWGTKSQLAFDIYLGK